MLCKLVVSNLVQPAVKVKESLLELLLKGKHGTFTVKNEPMVSSKQAGFTSS
jgi:hypothetical protein